MNDEPMRVVSIEELCEQLMIGKSGAYNFINHTSHCLSV